MYRRRGHLSVDADQLAAFVDKMADLRGIDREGGGVSAPIDITVAGGEVSTNDAAVSAALQAAGLDPTEFKWEDKKIPVRGANSDVTRFDLLKRVVYQNGNEETVSWAKVYDDVVSVIRYGRWSRAGSTRTNRRRARAADTEGRAQRSDDGEPGDGRPGDARGASPLRPCEPGMVRSSRQRGRRAARRRGSAPTDHPVPHAP